jgi:leader peptidase (prepilin peptidase)/N-methyltransferase
MLETLRFIHEVYPAVPAVLCFILGACMGSFFNVVIYRLPKQLSVVHPPSHCYSCGARIRWYDNLPILSWCILRGKARCCRAPFSIRYALVEALTGLLFLLSWLAFPGTAVVAAWFFCSFCVVGTFIDLDTMTLPDSVTLGGAFCGAVLSALLPALHGFASPELPGLILGMRGLGTSLLGMFVGSGLILWIAMFAEKLFRKEAMGFGDVLLMGMIGAFCGWQGAVFSIFGGSLIGAVVVGLMALINLITGNRLRPGVIENMPTTADKGPDSKTAVTHTQPPKPGDERADSDSEAEAMGLSTAIPFGPWLCAGALVYLLHLKTAVDTYFQELQTVIYDYF